MTRQTLATLALAGLLVLAGCGGSTTPATTGANATATGATTSSPTPTGPVYQPPLSPADVLAEHRAALDAAGSFTYRQHSTYRVAGTGIEQYTNITAGVDLAGNRTLVEQNITAQAESVVYGNATGGYKRILAADGVTYTRADGRVVDPGFYARPPIERYLRGLNYTYRGTSQRDGATVYTYVVESTAQLDRSRHGLGKLPPESITSIDSRISIRADGRIDSFEYRATGTVGGLNRTYTLAIEWAEVGSTTVSTPGWLDAARNATGR